MLMESLQPAAFRKAVSLKPIDCTSGSPRFMKGQGATEYLMLLGAVLLIGLVVISLLSFYPGTAGDTGITQSQIYWNSARVFSIKEASALSGIGCGSTNGGYKLLLFNTALDDVTLTNVSLDGESRPFCIDGASAPSASIPFGPADKRIIIVEYNSSLECSAGQFASKSVRFTYDEGFSAGLIQQGAKNLMLRCSS